MLQHLPATKLPQVASALELAAKKVGSGEVSAAIDLCQQALTLEPKNALAYLTLADALSTRKDYDKAIDCFAKAFKLAPNYLPAMTNYAIMLYEAGRRENALSAYRSVLALDAGFLPALDGIIQVLEDLRRFDQTLVLYEKLVRARGSTADLVGQIRALDMAGQPGGALKACHRAISKTSDIATFATLAGMIESSTGDKSAAIAFFQKAIAANSPFAQLHLAKLSPASVDLALLDKQITQATNQSIANARAPLCFAKANVLDHQNDLRAAFENFSKANRLLCQVTPDLNEERLAYAKAARGIFTPDQVAAWHEEKADMSTRPVFVTGLPRSGTTLVEQIIAAHSQAAGLGELELVPLLVPHELARLTALDITGAAKSYRAAFPQSFASARKIVDKSISSGLHLGFILAMFPQVRIIYCERHPMDVAWSAFKEYFNQGALDYTYSFERIAAHQQIYHDNIAHWHTNFPQQIMRLRYETLVNNPVETTRKLLEFLGLDFEESCLAFHQRDVAVRTASQAQVRQPIHAGSIGRWKPYATHLGELERLLAPLIKAYEGQ